MTNTLTDDEFVTPPAPEQLETVEWKPTTPGDTLIGTLRRRSNVDTKFGEKTVLDVVSVSTLTASGQPVDVPAGYGVTVWPSPSAIDAVDHAKVKVGDKFAIRLLDLVDTNKGNPWKKFGVKHLGEGDPFDTPTPTATSTDDEPF